MWQNIAGTSIDTMLADPNYLDNQDAPSSVQVFTDFFEAPSNICDNCATELVGYFLPPITGDYTFQVAADDNGVLYGGATEQAGAIIASCPGWASARQWDKYPEQMSAPQHLTAQEYYFLRAMSNEGGGGDVSTQPIHQLLVAAE